MTFGAILFDSYLGLYNTYQLPFGTFEMSAQRKQYSITYSLVFNIIFYLCDMCINKDIIRTAFFIDRYLYRIKKGYIFGGLRGISLSSYNSVSDYFSGH